MMSEKNTEKKSYRPKEEEEEEEKKMGERWGKRRGKKGKEKRKEKRKSKSVYEKHSKEKRVFQMNNKTMINNLHNIPGVRRAYQVHRVQECSLDDSAQLFDHLSPSQ